MGAIHWSQAKAIIFISCVLVVATVHASALLSSASGSAALELGGYTSHEERITEYLFDGEEPHPMWA